MKMIDYVLQLYPLNGNTIVSQTNDNNIFMVSSFDKKIEGITTFVYTDGKMLLSYYPSEGELARYDYIENKWVYYSWTFSRRDILNNLLINFKYNEFFNELKKFVDFDKEE